jgi:hypothetical protein
MLDTLRVSLIAAVEGPEDTNIYPALVPGVSLSTPILCPDEHVPMWGSVIYPAGGGQGVLFSPIGGRGKLALLLDRWRYDIANILQHYLLHGANEAPLSQRCYWGRGLHKLDFLVVRPLRMLVVLEEYGDPASLAEAAWRTVDRFLRNIIAKLGEGNLHLKEGDTEKTQLYARKAAAMLHNGEKLAEVTLHVISGSLDKLVAEMLAEAGKREALLAAESGCRQHNCVKTEEQLWKCVSHTMRLTDTCSCSYREHAKKLATLPEQLRRDTLARYGLQALTQEL